MNKIQSIIKKGEEGFIKKFEEKLGFHHPDELKDIKSYIHQSQKALLEAVVEWAEEGNKHSNSTSQWNDGYNSALSDLTNKIKESIIKN